MNRVEHGGAYTAHAITLSHDNPLLHTTSAASAQHWAHTIDPQIAVLSFSDTPSIVIKGRHRSNAQERSKKEGRGTEEEGKNGIRKYTERERGKN